MKLIVAVIHAKDADRLIPALVARGIGATTIDSSRGLLRQGNAALLIGVQEAMVADTVGLIKRHCQARRHEVNGLLPVVEPAELYVSNPVEVQVGGATVFVVSVDRYERIA